MEDEIKKETKLLKEGLLFFKPYTEASLQNIPKNDPSPRMYELISKLAPLLVRINKYFALLHYRGLMFNESPLFFLESRCYDYVGFSM